MAVWLSLIREEIWQRAVIYHDGAMYQFRFTERKVPAFLLVRITA